MRSSFWFTFTNARLNCANSHKTEEACFLPVVPLMYQFGSDSCQLGMTLQLFCLSLLFGLFLARPGDCLPCQAETVCLGEGSLYESATYRRPPEPRGPQRPGSMATWVPRGVPWDPMGSPAGIPWAPMGSHGMPWVPWDPMGLIFISHN